MTCTEFRDAYVRHFLSRTGGPLPDDLQTHAASCPSCAECMKEFGAIQRALGPHRLEEPSPALLAALGSIPRRAPARASWAEVLRSLAAVILVLVAIFVAGAFVPWKAKLVFDLAAVTVSLSLVFYTLFERRSAGGSYGRAGHPG